MMIRGTLRTNRIAHHHVNNVNPECTYCNLDLETINHLFWDCNIVSSFVNEVRDKLDQIFPNYFQRPNFKQFIFGFQYEDILGKNNILNLYIKSYIWKTKFGTRNLSAVAFLKWLSCEWNLNIKAFIDRRILHLTMTTERLDLYLAARAGT